MALQKSQRKAAEPTAAMWADEGSELRSWWIGADGYTKKMHSQIAETNEKSHGAIQRAQRFIGDAELESWVAQQNVCKGINPLPADTFREAKLEKRRSGVDVPKTHRGAMTWIQR